MLGRRSLLLLAGAGALSTAGCRSAIVRRNVERKLRNRLADWLGPAQKYEVHIYETQDPDLVLGKARRVEITGRKIRANEGFQVDWFKLTLRGLTYEGEAPYFVAVEHSELELELTETAVNDYLRTYQARYDPELHFGPNELGVKMTYQFLGKPTRIGAVGRFIIKDGVQLHFDAREATISFLNQPGFGERFVEDRVNPLLDLARVKFPAKLESVEILEGRLRARGTATLPSQEAH